MPPDSLANQLPPEPKRAKPRDWLRFSLRSLLVVTLVAAAFVAGRRSHDAVAAPELSGVWVAKLPRGAEQPTTLRKIDDEHCLLSSGGDVFNGVYRIRGRQLLMERPSDKRMRGLTWKWDGQKWLLVSEPLGTPTGSSYLGTELVRAEPEG